MNNDIRIGISLGDLAQLIEAALPSNADSPSDQRQLGPFTTVDERCKLRWPLASKKAKRRIRDACLGMYRQLVGRDPLKLNGYSNSAFEIEMKFAWILDSAIDKVRNDKEERELAPLFARRSQ